MQSRMGKVRSARALSQLHPAKPCMRRVEPHGADGGGVWSAQATADMSVVNLKDDVRRAAEAIGADAAVQLDLFDAGRTYRNDESFETAIDVAIAVNHAIAHHNPEWQAIW